MKINILEMIGEFCITKEAGQSVYEVILPNMIANQSVEIDFTGVRIFSSPFFNSAIGLLLKDLNKDELNRLLTISKLQPVGMDILKVVIENSGQYYSNPSIQKTLDQIISDNQEE